MCIAHGKWFIFFFSSAQHFLYFCIRVNCSRITEMRDKGGWKNIWIRNYESRNSLRPPSFLLEKSFLCKSEIHERHGKMLITKIRLEEKEEKIMKTIFCVQKQRWGCPRLVWNANKWWRSVGVRGLGLTEKNEKEPNTRSGKTRFRFIFVQKLLFLIYERAEI